MRHVPLVACLGVFLSAALVLGAHPDDFSFSDGGVYGHNLWVLTSRGELAVFRDTLNTWTVFQELPDTVGNPVGFDVSSDLVEDGYIWVLNDSNEVWRYRDSDQAWLWFSTFPSSNGEAIDIAIYGTPVFNRTIWILNDRRELYVYYGGWPRFATLDEEVGNPIDFSVSDSTSVGAQIWILNDVGELWSFDAPNLVLFDDLSSVIEAPKSVKVDRIPFESAHHWIMSENGELWRYVADDWSHYTTFTGTGMPRTWCILPDSTGDFPTIQAAVDSSVLGDTICVRTGTYHECLRVDGKTDLVLRARCCGPATGHVVLDPDSICPVVTFADVDSSVSFCGFTLTGGTYGLYLEDASPVIRNNIIHRNENGIELNNSSPLLANNVVDSNLVYGLYLTGSSCPALNSNIVTRNLFGIYGVSNCCVGATYNDVWGNTINLGGACSGGWPSDGNISEDPRYVSQTLTDYHLSVDSPCIDTGDPDPSMNDPDGSPNDMGAYGGPYACQDYPSYMKGLKAYTESTIVHATWNANVGSESIDYFIVYRDTLFPFMPDASTHYDSVAYPDTSFADTVGLYQRYSYVIAAVNGKAYQGGYSCPISVETCPLRDGVLTSSYNWGPWGTDISGGVVAEGVGLWDSGTGQIVIGGIPGGSAITKALLYWDRSPYMTLNNETIGATKIGIDDGASSYRADVGRIVNGNGTYTLAVDGPSNGASIVVVYENDGMDSVSVQINDGLDNEGHGSGGTLDNTYFGYDQRDDVQICYIVAGASADLSDRYFYNGWQIGSPGDADSSDGALWDTDWYAVPPEAIETEPGETNCSAHIVENTDSLHWVAAINVGLLVSAGILGEEQVHQDSWALGRIEPNPSGSACMIRFDVPRGGGNVDLTVYDVTGRIARTLADGRMDAGRHVIQWNGRSDAGTKVSPGIYFIRMEADDYTAARKLVLVR